jgi:hypothetical protein
MLHTIDDALPSSLMDLTSNPKVKTTKGKGVGARSLARNTLGVKGMLELQDETKKIDKHFIYSHGPSQIEQQIG